MIARINQKEKIIGSWIAQHLLNYLKDHKNKNAEKVLVKIEGINEEYFPAILNALLENQTQLKSFYEPLIRTIKQIDGYDSFVLNENENGVWLRNNVKTNEALILLMNERTPEAQSLKDIVSIDETQLLSSDGFFSLDQSLREKGYLEPHQIKDLLKLIGAYQHRGELDLQLSMLIAYIESVLQEKEISNDTFKVVLGKSLPHFRLFKDEHLKFESLDGLRSQLRKNFLLSHLRKTLVNYLEPEKLMKNVDNFIANEEKNNFSSEVWRSFNNDKVLFLEKTMEFIERRNNDLLHLVSYNDAERIFGFKVSNSLKDKLNNARDIILDNFAEKIREANSIEEENQLKQEKMEAESRFDRGVEAVNSKNDIEAIREFREEYEQELEKENIVKKIINIENKLENPSEYIDIFEAILSESLVMLEEIDHEEFSGNLTFEISIDQNTEVSEEQARFFNFHLKSLSMLSSNVIVLSELKNTNESSKEIEVIPVKLRLLKNENSIAKSTVKIDASRTLIETSFSKFINQIQDGFLHSIITKKGTPVEEDLNEYLSEQQNYTLMSDKRLLEPIEQFKKYNAEYTDILKSIIDENRGITTEDLNRVADLSESFLKCSDHDVDSVRKIYSLLNEIGTIKVFETKNVKQTEVERKIVSVFNPIRFIAYGFKLIHFGNLLSNISDTSEQRNKIQDVEDLKQYKEYLRGSFTNLAPSYYVSRDGNHLFAQDELYGQGTYIEGGEIESVSSQATSFAKEIEKVTNDYIRVYPYAADCLDILFLYVTNLEFVKKSVEQILKNDGLKKLNITIHSPARAAMLYDEINQWIQSQEEYINAVDSFGEFPRLEINVLPFSDPKTLEEKLDTSMLDFDLAVFIDYFGQSDNLKIPHQFYSESYKECELTDKNWVFYENREFKAVKEGTRLINYVSPNQPKLMQQFYNMQAILKDGLVIESNKIGLLKGRLSVTRTETNTLYKLAHEKFNWVVTYDRFMDPLLMKQVAEGSNIIRYHVNRLGKEEIKVLVSSSDSIRRSSKVDMEVNYYRDRLHSRLKDQLKVSSIDIQQVDKALKVVKELSGGLVLRALGPGKFVNEFLSVYLTVLQDEKSDDTVVLWDMCDELEWFRTRQKRPDLLKTTIQYSPETEMYHVKFDLIELKLIQEESYVSEVADAKVQLLSGEKTLKKFFRRFDSTLERNLYLNSFLLHLEDKRAYEEFELAILHELRNNENIQINFEFTKSIYAYIHNKNIEFEGRSELSPGHYYEKHDENEIVVNTFTRSYILSEMNVPDHEVNNELQDEEESVLEQVAITDDYEYFDRYAQTDNRDLILTETLKDNVTKENDLDLKDKGELSIINETQNIEVVEGIEQFQYPEEHALKNVQAPQTESFDEVLKKLGDSYADTLQTKLRINNVQFTVERTIVGASVIRIIGRIPSDQSITAVEKKAKDMPLWLHIDSPPTIFSDRNGINIDINRNDPDTIFFSQFMKYVRRDITQTDLKNGFLVPIGLNPLNEVMSVDFNGTEPHMLVAGSTGSGKSVSLNSIVMSMMCLYTPEELKFVFIDPKQVEFSMFEDVQHTDKVLLDLMDSADYLDVMIMEMENRYSKFKDAYAKNLKEYNEALNEENKSSEVLPRIVIVFDEFADFMMQDKEFAQRIETAIKRMGQKGRAAGIHMIVCTQSPKAEIINTTIKNNLLARLGLKVTDAVASNVVLDTSGAENLAGKGDYLLKKDREPVRGKSPYLEPQSLRALMRFFKNN
ncbi:FtsK/SpoIIIE domain-containing protein [Exiguobacterium sp. s91]|uniref:FtsK/SpoIIIE domain-containing protein n=1 Tax=Exiguobacterium sp. s91 TaxID=2751199 RepID=UPI001BE678D6|nr:FtsK/SpoIIIE domain-containing protein [Exiguobacterium sp. s91]